ncbi:MAG TPA: hypothetical protein VFX98_07195, partial [Longimicrobiaceae bacterium]|nr:hypothetical protein [Longimicrobiaceae bacterium]
MPQRVLLHFSPHGRSAPAAVRAFAAASGHPLLEVANAGELSLRVSRGYPAALVVDATAPSDAALRLCGGIKREAFTSVVPVVMYLAPGPAGEEAVAAALEAGADEVLGPGLGDREFALRLRMALQRAERDVGVHPTTLLPG